MFLKDVIGSNPIEHPCFLLAAWLTWALSTISVLASFYLSHLALRRAIAQIDDGTIYQQPVGGDFARWTAILNATGAILFLVGVCWISIFAGYNLSNKGVKNDRKETISTSTAAEATNLPTNSKKRQPTPPFNRGRLHPSTSPAATDRQ